MGGSCSICTKRFERPAAVQATRSRGLARRLERGRGLAYGPPVPTARLLRLHVNGETHAVAVPPQRTLLEALRYDVGLTGSKQGCDKGDCGACTVLARPLGSEG